MTDLPPPGWTPPSGPPLPPPQPPLRPPPPLSAYPPPPYSPPPGWAPPPKPGRPPWHYVLIVVGGLVAVVVGLAVLGVIVGASDDDGPSTVPTVGTGNATGPTIRAGAVSLTLPAGWVGGDASADAGFGAALFPDDTEAAGRADDLRGFLPNAVSILGVDEAAAREGSAFVENVSVLLDPSVPAGMDLDDVVDAQARGFELITGGDVEETEVIDLGRREVGRLRSEFNGVRILSYIVVDGDDTYVLTFSMDADADEDELLAVTESSVRTFSIG